MELHGSLGKEIFLLVPDVNMPGMSGLDLLPVAKRRRADLPVAAQTNFLTKPVDFSLSNQDVMA